eukprot:2989187-Rhodomonas_salina.1
MSALDIPSRVRKCIPHRRRAAETPGSPGDTYVRTAHCIPRAQAESFKLPVNMSSRSTTTAALTIVKVSVAAKEGL